jgi:ketosteroid isomerase-like protein
MDVATRPTTQLDPAFVERFSQHFFKAWNTLDGAGVAALCNEDIVWHEPLLPGPARSREEVQAFVTASGSALPDFHVEPVGRPHISPDEPIVLQRYRLTGTMTGTWPYTGRLGTGRAIDVLAVDEWTFRGERLSHYRTYYDSLDTGRQLGILPPVGSTAERTMVRVGNLKTRIERRRRGENG